MKKLGVNIVAYGNIPRLLNSFDTGWSLQEIDESLEGLGIGLMLLPVRGISKNLLGLRTEVLSYEDAWNNAEFIPAILKFLGDLGYLFKGSPTSQPGASALDRVSGMNYQGGGTLIDWLLFGTLSESSVEFAAIHRTFPNALETVHSECDGGTVVEIHPEFRREICRRYGLDHGSFLVWLSEQDFPICLDTFHTLQRGSRDGLEPNPVLPVEYWEWFIQTTSKRVKEVHFRLSKSEVKMVLSGRAQELPTYWMMRELYQRLDDGVFILEIYPELLSSTKSTSYKVQSLWWELHKALIH